MADYSKNQQPIYGGTILPDTENPVSENAEEASVKANLTALTRRLQAFSDEPTPCPFAQLVESIPDQELRETLYALVDDDSFAVTKLHVELRRAGFSIARDSISYHRKKVCTCNPLEGETVV